MSNFQRLIKDLFDRAVAVFFLVLMFPIFLVAGALIKLASPGPVFFTQERIGLHGRPFRIYKLRTMHVQPRRAVAGDSVTTRSDPRVFFGARLLRKTKLDEMPQLINLLNGSMSLVGPRPTVLEDHLRMDSRQQQRSRVKPGLTGLAQINGAAGIPWPCRIEYDLDYIARQSLWLDLKIILLTAWVLATGRADINPDSEDEWSMPPSPGETTAGQADASRRRAA